MSILEKPVDWGTLLIALLIPNLVGIISGIIGMSGMQGWYQSLTLPVLTPSGYVFPVVWTMLYTLMGLASYIVWKKGADIGIILYITQLNLNYLWTVVFFGTQNIMGGLFIILLLWPAIAATILSFEKVDKSAAYLLMPYLAWVTFATLLNVRILVLNA